MRRRYTVEKFAERIAAVKKAMPDAFIGIDVITGFPGETDADFMDSRNFLESISPAFLHIFPFSERANTPAVDLPNKVQSSVSTARVKELEALSSKLHYDFCSKAVGSEADVLFESTERGGFMTGFTSNYIKVKVSYNRNYINQIVRVKLLSIEENCDVLGQIVE
jgi:threonylcarbamoyladenosine tRNA methylthiotransferase MtaB